MGVDDLGTLRRRSVTAVNVITIMKIAQIPVSTAIVVVMSIPVTDCPRIRLVMAMRLNRRYYKDNMRTPPNSECNFVEKPFQQLICQTPWFLFITEFVTRRSNQTGSAVAFLEANSRRL